MIRQISIKNFAIIDDLIIDFNNGFNVFSGETGAGKSIIIDALSLLLGARADSSMVRHGTSKAKIEGVFELSDELIKKFELEDYAEDNLIIITKELDASGKSTCKVNGSITTISNIKHITENILDIHSQNDNQYLLNKNYHLDLLDAFANNNISNEKNEYASAYKIYKDAKTELDELKTLSFNQDLYDLMKFQYDEIEAADLKENEIEELEIEQKRIQNYAKISDKTKEINEALSGERGALSALYIAKRSIESMANDPLFAKYIDKSNELFYQLEDFTSSFKNDFGSISYDEYSINAIQERIFVVNKLKRKYGDSTTAILTKKNELAESLSKMENKANRIEELEAKMDSLRNDCLTKGKILDVKREEASKKLMQEIEKQLKDLYLSDAKFGLIINPLNEPNEKGISEYEFSASLNPGTPLKPLIKIASGGEMSRLMLGLKIVFNRLYGVSSSIFDEIDTGVSGKVARAVGLKMYELAKDMQVITITHSPQIASIGNYHYFVSKNVKNNETFSEVKLLNEEERIFEIAKMVSDSASPSKAAKANAKELMYK